MTTREEKKMKTGFCQSRPQRLTGPSSAEAIFPFLAAEVPTAFLPSASLPPRRIYNIALLLSFLHVSRQEHLATFDRYWH
jgi:hypothetical protein